MIRKVIISTILFTFLALVGITYWPQPVVPSVTLPATPAEGLVAVTPFTLNVEDHNLGPVTLLGSEQGFLLRRPCPIKLGRSRSRTPTTEEWWLVSPTLAHSARTCSNTVAWFSLSANSEVSTAVVQALPKPTAEEPAGETK